LNVLQVLLAAHATLLHQKRALGTRVVVEMAGMLNLRMTTCLGTVALVSARRWLSATWQRWLKHSSATVAAYLIEYGFPARTTRTLVTQLLARVVSTFQRTTARTSADVLWLKAIIDVSGRGVDGTTFALDGKTFRSLALARAASLVASVASTIECGATHAHALRMLFDALMTDGGGSGSSTATGDGNLFHAWPTVSGVAQLLARMST